MESAKLRVLEHQVETFDIHTVRMQQKLSNALFPAACCVAQVYRLLLSCTLLRGSPAMGGFFSVLHTDACGTHTELLRLSAGLAPAVSAPSSSDIHFWRRIFLWLTAVRIWIRSSTLAAEALVLPLWGALWSVAAQCEFIVYRHSR